MAPEPEPPAPEASIPLESDRPEAEEAPLPLAEEDASLVLARLLAVEDREEREGGVELVDDMVGVVEVKTFEKLAKPFMMLGLLRKGEFMPNCPSGL